MARTIDYVQRRCRIQDNAWEALKELEKLPYNKETIDDDIQFIANKLDISVDEFGVDEDDDSEDIGIGGERDRR